MNRNPLRTLCLCLALVMLLSAASGAAAAGGTAAAVLPGNGQTCVLYHPGVQAVLGLPDVNDPETGLPPRAAALNDSGQLTYDDISDGGLVFRVTTIKENGVTFYLFSARGRYLALTAAQADADTSEPDRLCLAEWPDAEHLAEIQWKPEQTEGGWVLYNRAMRAGQRRCIAFSETEFRGGAFSSDAPQVCALQFFCVEDRDECGYVSRPKLRLDGEPPLGGAGGAFQFTVESPYTIFSVTVEEECAVSEEDGTQRVLRTRLPKPTSTASGGSFSIPAADMRGCDRLAVRVTVEDVLGRLLVARRSFQVPTLPQITELCPADGTTVSGARPVISASVQDAGHWQEAPLPDRVDPVAKFRDVKAGKWYTAPVDYVVELGLMAGMEDDWFGVQSLLTREQFLTILWSLDGKPGHTCENPFTDVKPSGYAYNAILWAYESGITSGQTETRFGRKEAVSRQDLACFFYRYAQLRCLDTRQRADLSVFSDAKRVKAYAVEPMRWAVANQLFAGSNGKLLPRDSATRAEIAAVMRRFDALPGPRMEEITEGVTVKLWLDGYAVTAALQNGQVVFRPEEDLAPGRHTVLLAVTRSDGTVVSKQWTFRV